METKTTFSTFSKFLIFLDIAAFLFILGPTVLSHVNVQINADEIPTWPTFNAFVCLCEYSRAHQSPRPPLLISSADGDSELLQSLNALIGSRVLCSGKP